LYQTPELLHIGAANNVVLGIESIGGDLYGELDYRDLEFEKD
jgi:hypothetical protein